MMMRTSSPVAVASIILFAAGVCSDKNVSLNRPLEHRTANLWPEGAVPAAHGGKDDKFPYFFPYWPEPRKDTGTAIIVIPGGSYKEIVQGSEGNEVAQWLADIGITGLSLWYRNAGWGYDGEAMILDVMRAVRYVRFNAKAWGINKDRIGVMGFSAGGHLASMALTLFDSGDPLAKDPVDRESSRPSFGVLSYPVISMREELTHSRSRESFLGANVTAEREQLYSAELQVHRNTPPCFIWHGTEDPVVPALGSILFQEALMGKKVPSELHLYAGTGHGGGMGVPFGANGLFKQYESGRTRHGLLHRWTFDLRNFLTIQGFVPPKRKRTRQHHNVGVEVQEEGEEVEGDGEEDTQSPL